MMCSKFCSEKFVYQRLNSVILTQWYGEIGFMKFTKQDPSQHEKSKIFLSQA